MIVSVGGPIRPMRVPGNQWPSTKKKAREVINRSIRRLWADPYVRANFAAEIHDLAITQQQMHNRNCRPRARNCSAPMLPAVKQRIVARYHQDPTQAYEMIGRAEKVNIGRPHNVIHGVRE